MKVKVFTAATMQEAIAQMKLELGLDAVILHTRRVRKGGFWGYFGKEMVEVMAAVDPAPAKAAAAPVKTPPAAAVPAENQAAEIQKELSQMRLLLEQAVRGRPLPAPAALSPLAELLVRRDVEETFARRLAEGLDKDAPGAAAALAGRLAAKLPPGGGIELTAGRCKTVALIGPTGVGKTTTAAKIAAHFTIEKKRRVALITADTYRISAVDQLKTYSDIIGVPLEIVYAPHDLKNAADKHRDKDLILIDTAGRSPHNQFQVAELQMLLEACPHIERYLTVSATTKYKEALDIVRRFSVCSPHRLLFTKIDECSNIGTVINIIHQFPIALSYMTTGQSVPDDIKVARPKDLAELLLRP